MSRRLHYRRFWLNRPGFHSTAFVEARIELDKSENGGLDLMASYQLADCRRSATLDFDVFSNHSAADRRNALRKARLLRESVNAFCDALEAAAAEQKKAAKKRQRKSA
ncbi:hypothetical protein [Cryptosporangium japonicum]|uniref:Uncharacterized protein n=1 Tax=Cryptosporangium japonicum TaxID=80872 RepID=A0ABP3D096_9ACTN